MPAKPTPWRLARHARAGVLDAVRVTLRVRPDREQTGERPGSDGGVGAEPARIGATLSGPGAVAAGMLEVGATAREHGDGATLSLSVANRSDAPVFVESVAVELRWREHDLGALRFLRHGWQSWSQTEPRALDAGGEPAFPSGPWLRGMHHALGAPPPDRAGWHESHLVTVVGAAARGPACVAGVLETGRAFGLVYLRREEGPDGALALDVEQRLEVPLAPGERRALEDVRVALGEDVHALLESFALLHGRTARARTASAFQAGWCSWYHFFHAVTEDDLLRNLDVLTRERDAIPVDLVQLDDGYQRAIGDWLETNAKFPRGLAPLADAIRAAGFSAGLWTAPFCVVEESRVFAEHPDWLLRHGDDPFRALVHGEWSPKGWVYALDTTREDVLAHLESLFRELVQMGFSYQKLDFLYAAAMECRAHARHMTRAQRLRRGLEAVRRGCGDDAFLLGCGCPLGPAVGVVDGMRIGPDVAPAWSPDAATAIPGLEEAQPSTRSAVRSVLNRAWMHRRLWLNDPDCLMVRSRDTRLSLEESRTLATAIAATGGMLVVSDDLAGLPAERRALVGEALAVAREVDAAASVGVARATDLLEREIPARVEAGLGWDALVARVNAGDAPAEVEAEMPPGGGAAEPLLGSARPGADGRVALAPHASALWRLGGARRPAVFCDFDGTFSVQDVGSTLARLHCGERRAELWPLIESGELTPWQYNMRLLDGLALPESELDAFLRGVELDPGAKALVEWCRVRKIPFRVLSDGFDWNLDRLQQIHGVAFEYAANRLRYDQGRWRIEPGGLDADCLCGTGTCKRAQIEAWRAAHPGAVCIHVGNGRVSDLCAAIAADRTFAKDTLAPALDERGIHYERFETLHDVIEALERTFG